MVLVSVGFLWRHFWQVLIDEKSAKVAGIRVSQINIVIAILIGGGITASLTIV